MPIQGEKRKEKVVKPIGKQKKQTQKEEQRKEN